MKRLVGIDVGTKRVGIAITDPLRVITQPFGTFSPPETAFIALQTLLQTEAIEAFVVGWPLTEDGQEGEATQMVERFLEKLGKTCPNVPIIKWDERYTSELAKETIRFSGLKAKARRERSRVDRMAAAILLQDYIASLN